MQRLRSPEVAALNAVTAWRDSAALAEAAALDERRARGEPLGALAGVPVLVKDLEDVAGMTTTMGSVVFADADPKPEDSTVPALLRQQDAIVVGKSNLPEFAIEGYTDNLLFGATSNPWRVDYSPGGSSGGSAAAVASGAVPIATATDGGGSIRIPAAFCGLVGLKPTNGVVGRWPAPDWIDFSTEGPLATTVADLRLLMHVIRGPVPGDPTALPGPPRPGASIRRVFRMARFSAYGPLPADVQQPFDAACRSFADVTGREVVDVSPEQLWPGCDPDLDWFTLATAEHVARFGRAWIEDHLDRFHPSSQDFFRWGLRIDVDSYLAARRRRFDYVRALDELLGSDGVLLSPTVAMSGWTVHGHIPGGGDAPLPPDAYATAIQNITGHPAVTMPAGTHDNGVPFGLQITGPRFADELLLDVAELWQVACPWPLTAPGFPSFVDAVLG